MCLIKFLGYISEEDKKLVKNKYIKILEEDKTVYKILLDCLDGLSAPYRDFVYDIGRKYHIDELGTKIKEGNSNNSYLCVYEGFHAYTNLVEAQIEVRGVQELNDVVNDNICRPIIVECTYPKGSKYCKDNGECVSDTIIINKIVSK